MKLSDAIRKHLTAWQELRQIDSALEGKGLSIEFDEGYDPGSGELKFRNVRVVIDVRKALPSLEEFFTKSDLPFPIDPTEGHDGAIPEFFDVGDEDDELSTILGFDPSSASDLERFIKKNTDAGDAGFDVVTAQPKSYGGTD